MVGIVAIGRAFHPAVHRLCPAFIDKLSRLCDPLPGGTFSSQLNFFSATVTGLGLYSQRTTLGAYPFDPASEDLTLN